MSKAIMKRILTILTYFLAAVAVVAGTVILVAVGRGYGYDFKHHRFTISGLIIFNSTPGASYITIGGKYTKHKTPYHISLEPGSYTVKIDKEGYLPWQKVLTVNASAVTFAEYIILIPQHLTTGQYVSTPKITLSAPDKADQHLAYVASDSPSVRVMNLNNKQSTSIFTPKAAAPGGTLPQVTGLTWSDDGSHLLIKTTADGKDVYWVVAADGSQAIDVTDLFGFDFNSLRFNPANWHELYWVSPEGLRKLDVTNQTVSAVLADNVTGYTFGTDRIYYIQTTDKGPELWSIDNGGHKQQLIQSLAASPSYQIEYENYQGRDLVGIIPSSTHTLTIYFDVLSQTPAAKIISRSADYFSFSPGGRFMEFNDQNTLGSYDVQDDILTSQQSPGGPINTVSWYDGYHLLINSDSKLFFADYDGTNSHDLAGMTSGASTFPSADGKKIFSVGQGMLDITQIIP